MRRSYPSADIRVRISDDFERAELGKDQGWAIVVPTRSLENGTLKGTRMRFDAPLWDGHSPWAGRPSRSI
jgi:hypothetical protein